MRKVILFLLMISIALPNLSFAQTPSGVDQQINDLKNKVASKVAQLKLVEKRGVIGKVTDVTNTQITISDINENPIEIDVDELTDFSSSNISSFDISDIKKGMEISVLGLYNKDSERLLARFVDETTIPVFLQGVITQKDSANYTVTLSTQGGTAYLVDIENVTKTLEYTNGDLSESGFSKLPNMVNAIVVGFPNSKEKDRITAGRIITFPDSPKDPKVPIIQASPSSSPAPSK